MSRINGNHQPQEPPAVNGRVSIASKRALTRQYMGTMPTMHNRPRDLPPLNADLIRAMLLDSAVRLGLAMRAAPLMASEIAFKDGDKWTPGVRAEIPEVGEFIRRQYARIWLNGLESILTGQIWGWASGEVMLRTTRIGTVEVDYLLPRSAMDTRALISDGEVAGCRVLKVKDVGHVDLKFPKGFFHAHRPEPGSHYGQSILLGCYSPWADKCFQGGALDVRRLFMHKDAYGGCDISYPDSTTIINGEEIPNRDIALQIVEQIQAGGVTTRPASYDVNGKEQWTITRATVPPSPGHILEYPKDLDTEIFHGMEIPDDVIESENGGAWAGKQVPMAAFYSSLDVWLISIIRDIDKQIIKPLLALNFRKPGAYEVTHKPLAVQASEQQQQAQQPPNGQQPGAEGGQMPGLRMGLDAEEAIGEGVLSAAEMVQAARRVMALRMNVTDSSGHEHKGKGTGGGQFTSTSTGNSHDPDKEMRKASYEGGKTLQSFASRKAKEAESKPLIASVDEIKSLLRKAKDRPPVWIGWLNQEVPQGLFVRWSSGPSLEREGGASRDAVSGSMHLGLSANEINEDDDDHIMRRVGEYRMLELGGKVPYLFWGARVGTDSDGAALTEVVEPIAKVSKIWENPTATESGNPVVHSDPDNPSIRMNVTDDEGHIHAADGKFTNKPDGAGKPRKKTPAKPAVHPASAPHEPVDMDEFHKDYDVAHGDAQPHEDVLIKDLREKLPQYTPGQFNYGIRKLREQGYLTAESAHGGVLKGDELLDRKNHGIKEGPAPHQELVYLARRKRRDAATKMAAAHAPKGGVTVAGKEFTGGEFIPGEVMKKATAEERRAIAGGKQAKNKQAPSAKSATAKSSAKRIAGDVQRYAEEHNEPRFAKAIGGASFRDNEPIDVVLADDTGRVAHGIELKTMVDNSNNKITMKGDAIKRKLQWSRRNKAAIHTVVIDDSAVFNANGPGQHDEAKRRFFYRRGVGSFRIGKMLEVKSVEEIKRLLTTPTRQLPEGAR